MRRTPFGRHLLLIGGNATAAFRAGIRVDRLTAITFILAGAIAGLAGWLLAIRTSGATANLGIGMLFQPSRPWSSAASASRAASAACPASMPACCCSPRSRPRST